LKSYIEEIINDSLLRVTSDIELLRNTLLTIIHANIDGLIDHSEQWFGGNVPLEYKKIIRSLLTIPTTFLSRKIDYRDFILDKKITEVNIIEMLREIVDDFTASFSLRAITIESDLDSCHIFTSLTVLKKSIYNIMMSFILFMDEHSRCRIDVRAEHSNIIMDFKFQDLSENFPGVDIIQKEFFPYFDGNTHRVGVGINTALYNLKSIGSIVKVDSLNRERSLGVKMSFPTMEFMTLVDEIRKSEIISDNRKIKDGDILVVIEDFIVDMILSDVLRENGYTIIHVTLKELETVSDIDRYKALIVDYRYLSDRAAIDRFPGSVKDCRNTIIILGNDDDLPDVIGAIKGVQAFKKPVEIDAIIKYIEGIAHR